MKLAEFWSPAHHGNAFGVKGTYYGPNGHRGDDTNGWDVGTPIPSYVEGIVVASGWLSGTTFRPVRFATSGLGWVVVVYCPRLKMWVGFCHLDSKGLPVGTSVRVGDDIGPLGNTGTLSTGAHVHTTCSLEGANPALAAVIDPRPFIDAAIKQEAEAAAAAARRRKTMRIIQIVKDPSNRYNDSAWPLGTYIATESGIAPAATSPLSPSIVNRLAGDPGTFPGVAMYGAEAKQTDDILRKIANTGIVPDIDEEALAKLLAPLLSGVSDVELAAAVSKLKAELPGLVVQAAGAALANG